LRHALDHMRELIDKCVSGQVHEACRMQYIGVGRVRTVLSYYVCVA
jgi:hypothetical protein